MYFSFIHAAGINGSVLLLVCLVFHFMNMQHIILLTDMQSTSSFGWPVLSSDYDIFLNYFTIIVIFGRNIGMNTKIYSSGFSKVCSYVF